MAHTHYITIDLISSQWTSINPIRIQDSSETDLSVCVWLFCWISANSKTLLSCLLPVNTFRNAPESRKLSTVTGWWMRDWRTHMRSFSCHAVTTGITSSSVSSLKIALQASALSLSLWRITGTCHKAHQKCSPIDAVFFARKQHSHTAPEEGSRAQKPHVKPPSLLLRVNFGGTYHGQSLYTRFAVKHLVQFGKFFPECSSVRRVGDGQWFLE